MKLGKNEVDSQNKIGNQPIVEAIYIPPQRLLLGHEFKITRGGLAFQLDVLL